MPTVLAEPTGTCSGGRALVPMPDAPLFARSVAIPRKLARDPAELAGTGLLDDPSRAREDANRRVPIPLKLVVVDDLTQRASALFRSPRR